MNTPNEITFYEWDCPNCQHITPIEDADIQRLGFNGTVQCNGCDSIFDLTSLYENGLVWETKA